MAGKTFQSKPKDPAKEKNYDLYKIYIISYIKFFLSEM